MADVPVLEAPPTAPSRREGSRLARIPLVKVLVVGGVIIIVAYLALVPLFYLAFNTFFGDGQFTLEPFRRAYSTYGLGELVANSMVFAVASTLVSLFLGMGLAFLTERTDIPFKGIVFTGALLPLVVPGVLYTISWVFIGSPRIGIANSFLEPALGPEALNIFSMVGMILVAGLDSAPLAFLLMVAAFRSMDPALEESAMQNGARLGRVFRTITMPLALPAVLAALLILTVRNIESFETPAVLGIPANIWVFTSRIWRTMQTFPPDYGQAGAYSFSLLVFTTVGLLLYYRALSRGKRYQTVTGKGFRPRALPLGRARRPVTVLVGLYILVAVVFPTLVLVYASLQPYYAPLSIDSLQRITFENYVSLLDTPQIVTAFKNSVILAVATGTLVMVMSAVAAWVVVRTRIPGRWLVDNLTLLPLVLPGLVLGVSLLIFYLNIPVAVYGTLWILLIAYSTKSLPYGMRYASASMYQIGSELEESAEVSGAPWGQVFRHIILPLLAPGMLAGWLYIVMTSVRELSSSLLLYSPGNEVLSIIIWELWTGAEFVELSALGVVMIVFLVLLVLVARTVSKRFGVRGPGAD